MSESEEYHRDIYSGMVAKALSQEGYFGEDYRVYAFLGRMNGQTTLEVYEDELICAQRCYQLLAQGIMVSEASSRSVRSQILSDQEKQQLRKRFSEEIRDELAEVFLAEVQTVEGLPKEENCMRELAAYVEKNSSDSQKREALIGLLAGAKRYRHLTEEDYRQLTTQLPQAEQEGGLDKKFYGFLWKDQMQWSTYSNGYLPAVLKKWQTLGRQKRLTTPIVSQSYPFNQWAAGQIKESFARTLQQIFDADYLQICERMLTFRWRE